MRQQRFEDRVILAILSVLAVLLAFGASPTAAQTYKITNLGAPSADPLQPECPECRSRAFDINNKGQVVGIVVGAPYASQFANVPGWPFRTASNQPINFPSDRLTIKNFARAYSINDNGEVVGAFTHFPPIIPLESAAGYDDTSYLQPQGFFFESNGPLVSIRPAPACSRDSKAFGCPSSSAFAINDLSRIVGFASRFLELGEFEFHAFRLDTLGQLPQDLGTLPNGGRSEARAINDLGVIVGFAENAAGVRKAVRFSGSSANHLGTLGGSACPSCTSAAYGINNVVTNPPIGGGPRGQVVGESQTTFGPRHAFFLDLGGAIGSIGSSGMQDLGNLCQGLGFPLCRSAAFAINDIGQIVGESATGSDATHAFLYRLQEGVMTDLNDLIAPAAQLVWTLTDARGINDLGQIVGTGRFVGKMRAYRLDPPPSNLVTNLDDLLELFNLADRGIEQSLRAKLRAIQAALAREDRPAACGQRGAFDHDVRAQAGRGLTHSQATKLMAGAALLQRDLECR